MLCLYTYRPVARREFCPPMEPVFGTNTSPLSRVPTPGRRRNTLERHNGKRPAGLFVAHRGRLHRFSASLLSSEPAGRKYQWSASLSSCGTGIPVEFPGPTTVPKEIHPSQTSTGIHQTLLRPPTFLLLRSVCSSRLWSLFSAVRREQPSSSAISLAVSGSA